MLCVNRFRLLLSLCLKSRKYFEYLELEDKTDNLVEVAEPGKLHHTLNQESEDPHCLVWSEAYKYDDICLVH